MARKKEKTTKEHVTAEHWSIVHIAIHPNAEVVTAKWGLFTSKANKKDGAHPLETFTDKVHDVKALEDMTVGHLMNEVLDKSATAPGAPLEGSTPTAD